MRAAVPPPASRGEMVVTLARAFCGENPAQEAIPSGSPNWNGVAEIVEAWLAYERDLSHYAIDPKLKAARAAALEEAALYCQRYACADYGFMAGADWCAVGIRRLAARERRS